MDIKKQSEEERNALERLLHTVPGFKGYFERELRRDADKVQRMFLVAKLRGARDRLQEIIRGISRQGRLDLLTGYDELMRLLDRVMNQIEYAARGYSGFFDLVKIKERELDAIYRHDLGLIEEAASFSQQLDHMAGQPSDPDILEGARELLKSLDDGFRRREEILAGFGEREDG